MRSDRRSIAALAALGTLLATSAGLALVPAEAQAFCRTRTVVPPPNFVAGPGANDCFQGGLPLYHPSQCLPYRLLAKESPIIPKVTLSSALARAFATWTTNTPACVVGIDPVELAETTDTKIADYVTGQRGNNVVGVVEGPWPHGGGDTLSLATLTFNADTGEIFDADLEIRGDIDWAFASSSTPPPPDKYDFDAVITHEAGHFLGLAHSPLPEATMFASYSPGSTTQRNLSKDDADGICAIYPNRQVRMLDGSSRVASTACDLSPGVPGAPGNPCGDPVVTHGCGVGAGAPPRDGAWLAALGILGALAWRSRRRLQRA